MIEGLPERIHLLGAGGAGMFPLAIYLSQSGHAVSAEDDAFDAETRQTLETEGVRVCGFADAAPQCLVFSSAIAESHPARMAATQSGLQLMRRGECLSRIAAGKRLIGIAGSHGKTTTCAMAIDVFERMGIDCDYVLGARFASGLPARARGADWLIAELDESDGTIEGFAPEISVILNVDHDHHARYPTEADYRAAFERLASRTSGTLLCPQELDFSTSAKRLRSGEEFVCEAGKDAAGWSRLDLSGELELEGLRFNRTGEMNAIDASFAVAAGLAAGGSLAPDTRLAFRAVRRRQRCVYLSPAVQVFEDYAHHPREIDAVLQSAATDEDRDLIVVFQPHRYTRTKALGAGLAESLASVPELYLQETYAASESELAGGRGADLLAACRAAGMERVALMASDAELLERLMERIAEGKASLRILFLGAGTGDRLADALRDRLRKVDAKWGAVFEAVAGEAGFATEIKANEALARKTTLRVGGAAECYFEPESLAQLQAALRACAAAGIRVWPLGRGSNLVVSDAGVRGLVVRLSHPYWSGFEALDARRARCGAGMRIKALCGQAAKLGLEGFEFLEGIPGSLGGVLRMNAGAMGGWISDVVASVRFLSMDGELIERTREELKFGYRFCEQLKDAIAIDAVLVSARSEVAQEQIRGTIDTYQNKRKESQPREPSAGCIFKNPEGDAAGRLVDELGLKGAVVGGAEVSGVHGNFIVNRGGATSADVVELVRMIRGEALRKRGVDLHPEVLLFGENWEDLL